MTETVSVGVRPSRDRLIWLVSAGLAAAGALLWWSGLSLPGGEPNLWWPAVALGFALSESFAVHLPFGRDTHSLTFSIAPMVLGLFFLEADELLLAAVLGMALTQAVIYRNAPIKLVFNVASIFAQSALAIAVFDGIVEALGVAADSLTPATWLAAIAAALAADLLGNVALFVIIGLRQHTWDTGELARTLAI